MAKQIEVAEQLGDKGAMWRGNLAGTANIRIHESGIDDQSDDTGVVARDYRNIDHIGNMHRMNGQYDKAIDLYKELALANATQLVDTREVARAHKNTGNIYTDNGQYKNANDELGDKETARKHCNIGIAYNSIGQHGNKALECHFNELKTAQALGDKEVIGRIYDNIGLNYESIGEFREAIDFHLKASEIFKDLGDKGSVAKTQLWLRNLYDKIDREKRHENMENVCILSIGGQYDKTINCHHKHEEIAEGLGDKQDAKTIPRNNGIMSNGNVGTTGYGHKQSDVRGMLGMTQERREHLTCKCVFILSNADNIPSQMIERFQEALILQDFETTRGGVVVRFTTPVVKVTYQKFLDGAIDDVDGKAAKNDIVCHCKTIFATIEGVLFEEGLCSHCVKTCQEDSVMLGSGGAQGLPTDAELLVTKVESLTTELCLVKNSMIRLLTRDINREDGADKPGTQDISSEYRLNEARWKQLAEMKSKYQGILRQLRLLNEELGVSKNARALQGRETKSIQSDSAAMETSLQDVCPLYSEDADMINETPEVTYGVQKPDEATTTILEENYPVSMLLEYFTSSLQEQDWDELRRVMQYHIPENVLRGLPNGIGIFEELVDRNFVSDQDMKLLRDVFYQIQRMDCVHLIDRAKESDCSLLVENVQAVNVGQQKGPSVAAVQEIRRTPVERHQPELGRASGFQVPANVRDSTERLAGTNVCNQLDLREARIGNGTQGHGDDHELPYQCKNSPRTSQTSHVQKDAPRVNPVTLASDIIGKCQIRKEGADVGFEANKATGLSITTRGTRPSESEEQIEDDNEISKGEDKRNNTGCENGGSYKVESWTTLSCEAGCCNTGSCEANSDKTESCCAGSDKFGSCGIGCCDGGNNHGARRGGQGNSNWAKDIQFPCEHYKRYCDVQFGCCERFWPCHRCHNSESQCEDKKLLARDITKIRCKRCSRVQEFPKENPCCVECGLKFSEYFCALCQHLTGMENHPYHCNGCGICRVKEDRSFHCDVCGVCMDVKLLENHKCRPDSAHDECCICFEDAFYGCHILPCSHKVHVNCMEMMLKNRIKTCPVCRKPFSSKSVLTDATTTSGRRRRKKT